MRLTLLISAILVTLPGRSTLSAQTPPAGFQEKTDAIRASVTPGEVAENITSAFDPTQTYAVYLPAAYQPEKTWPALFLMDPRGRARVPLDRFVPVADRFGYVLVSSYNTASDVDEDTNTPAVRAMLTDTSYTFSLDRKRFYLSGFSGTARAAWVLAAELQQFVAGIIGFGGGPPSVYELPKKTGYVFYGSAGLTDFNYDEMRALDGELDDHEITHRFDFFEGGHQWGPSEVCTRAVEWLEIQAMKSGMREKNDGIVADIYAQRVSQADNAEDLFETFLEYQAVVEDFAGLVDGTTLDEIVAKVRQLEERDEVRDTRKLEERLAKRHRKYQEEYARFFRRLNADVRPWMLRAIIRELDLSDLKKQAVDESEMRKARAAQRILETVYLDAAFYFPRRYLEEGEPSHAVTMLQVADYIRPGVFRNFLYLARAYAQKADTAKAIESLQKAHEIRPLDPDLLTEDTYLDPIREEPAFKELLQSLNDPRSSASFPLIRD